MIHATLPADMIGRDTTNLATQRLIETEAAIREQRRYLETLSDPALRAIAARTLVALEDMLLIMTRTMQLTARMSDAGAEPEAH